MNFDFEIIRMSPVANEKIDYTTVVFRINLGDKLDIDNSRDLWLFLKTLISGGSRKIFVDMKNLEYIDSSGIGILINSAKMLRKLKGDIILSDVNEEIINIFKVIHLENFIHIYKNEVEALNSFRYV